MALLGNIVVHATLPLESCLSLALSKALGVSVITGLLNQG